MPTYNYPFSGGNTGIAGFGDRWQIQFGGTWAADEKWGLDFVSTIGDFSIGSNNFFSQQIIPLVLKMCFTYRNRVYLATGGQFNFSDNGDPTGWEQQNPGAGVVTYLSYFGGIDKVNSLSQLQGRLVVIARRSVQIWTVDADPGNFALVQEMDNIGSLSTLATQNIGDFDVIILDGTGFRSLRTREVTLNAYVDDVGVSIDSLVQTDLQSVSAATCVGIVEPTLKNYWGYLNGKIYILARYPSSKVSAWTTYLPTYETYTTVNANNATYDGNKKDTANVTLGQVYKWTPGAHEVSLTNGTQTLTAAGYFTAQGTTVTFIGTAIGATYTGSLQSVAVVTFTPQKFVVFNGLVYGRCANRELVVFGGTNGQTYDGCVATVQIPWLDDKQPKLTKLSQGIDAALVGFWHVSASMDPVSGTFEAVWDGPPTPTGSELTDSSYDYLNISWARTGTHFAIKLTSDPTWNQIATVSELQFHYNKGDSL